MIYFIFQLCDLSGSWLVWALCSSSLGLPSTFSTLSTSWSRPAKILEHRSIRADEAFLLIVVGFTLLVLLLPQFWQIVSFRRQCWSSSQFSTSLPWALSAPTPSCKEGSLLIVIMVIFMAITIMSLHKKPDWSWFDLEKMSQVFDWNVRNQSSANKCFSINSKIGLTLHRMHQITFPPKSLLWEDYWLV